MANEELTCEDNHNNNKINNNSISIGDVRKMVDKLKEELVFMRKENSAMEIYVRLVSPFAVLHAFCFISNTFISKARLKLANFQNYLGKY